MKKDEAPLHDCPVMGKDTPMIRTINIKTDERDWTCIWCLMAQKVLGEL